MLYVRQYNIVMVLVTMYIAFVAGVAVYVNLAHMADLLRMGGWVTHDYALMAAASVVVGAWWVTDLPFLANVLAMAMGLLMLKTTQLSSIKAGFILLVRGACQPCCWRSGRVMRRPLTYLPWW